MDYPKHAIRKAETDKYQLELYSQGRYYYVQGIYKGLVFTSVPIKRLSYALNIFKERLESYKERS
jgi:hypothetical protein